LKNIWGIYACGSNISEAYEAFIITVYVFVILIAFQRKYLLQYGKNMLHNVGIFLQQNNCELMSTIMKTKNYS
jgi:hypothetical protein